MNYYVFTLELAACIISVYSFTLKGARLYQLLSVLLCLTVLNEGWLVPYLRNLHPWYNNVAYNAFSLVDMTTWFFLFFLIYKSVPIRAFILAGYGLCIAYSLWELFYAKGWTQFHTDSLRVYNIFIIILSFLYFYQKLKEPYYHYLRDPIFCICAACFLFHSILFINLTTLAERSYWKMAQAPKVFFLLHNTGNTFYYFLLSLSFILCYYRFRKTALISSRGLS